MISAFARDEEIEELRAAKEASSRLNYWMTNNANAVEHHPIVSSQVAKCILERKKRLPSVLLNSIQ
jgi:hypothetical protein